MKKFQKNNRFKEIMQSKIVLILLGLIVLALFYSVYGLMNRMQETAKNKKIEQNKITELKQRKDKLTTDITSLKTIKGVEENIRDKFGLTKEGEDVIIVVDNNQLNKNTDNTSNGGFFSFFKNLFK